MEDEQIDQIPSESIRTFFRSLTQQVFRTRELQKLISKLRSKLDLAASIPFESVLTEAGLKEVVLRFPNRQEVRYCLGEVSVYDLALSLNAKSYLTHHTALFLNGLTDMEANDIYVNVEQSEKLRWESGLEQKNIDRAFGRQPRVTNNIADYDGRRLILLSGKQTGGLGIVTKPLAGGLQVRMSGIERSLIDAVVRPIYCGGIEAVQSAYRNAKGKVSVSLLAKILKQLDHLYPYHQSVGFLLDNSGVYTESEMEPFLRMQKEYDFYLDYQMEEPEYSKRWRIYFPKSLNPV